VASDAVRVRPMTRSDVEQCRSLLTQLGYEMSTAELERRFSEVSAAPDHSVLVAERAGRVVGLMHVFVRPAIENPREAVVQAIVVEEGLRRAGIGRELMTAAENWGRERGCRSVVLSSNTARAPAHTFYAALGYRVSATSLVLRKELTQR
jgi:GNAT superfamily N-acetyltransferase